ncbi:hypothetical protein PR002_g26898 [Phytophthora rubi]|uniref:Uncharacterized protein n=1 Tax=Phytophthora rubi TaxID=129364 RepID=A0A6A3HPE2_9STRA|nr:hypothetical protein PR002_g26898 [Phytophthora rubi]
MAKRGRFEENEEDEAKVVKIQEMKDVGLVTSHSAETIANDRQHHTEAGSSHVTKNRTDRGQ